MKYVVYLAFDPDKPDAGPWIPLIDNLQAQISQRKGTYEAVEYQDVSIGWSRDKQRYSIVFRNETKVMRFVYGFVHGHDCWNIAFVEISHRRESGHIDRAPVRISFLATIAGA